MSSAWLAVLPPMSLCHGFLVLALRLQTCSRKPYFLYLWAGKKGGLFIFAQEETCASWTLIFWQVQSTNLLLLNKLWQKSECVVIFFLKMFFHISEMQHDFISMFKRKKYNGWWNLNCRLKCVTVTQKSLHFLSLNYLKISLSLRTRLFTFWITHLI